MIRHHWLAVIQKKKFFFVCRRFERTRKRLRACPRQMPCPKGTWIVERDQGHCQAPHRSISSCGRVPAIFSKQFYSSLKKPYHNDDRQLSPAPLSDTSFLCPIQRTHQKINFITKKSYSFGNLPQNSPFAYKTAGRR